MAVIIGNSPATLNHPAPHPALHCCGIAFAVPKFAAEFALIFSTGWLDKPGENCAPGVVGGLGQSCLPQAWDAGGENRLGKKIINFWLEFSSGFEVAEAFWHLRFKAMILFV